MLALHTASRFDRRPSLWRVYIQLNTVKAELNDWQFEGQPAQQSMPKTIGTLEVLKQTEATRLHQAGLRETEALDDECTAPPTGWLFVVDGNNLGLGIACGETSDLFGIRYLHPDGSCTEHVYNL